jgi:hypothetical protein
MMTVFRPITPLIRVARFFQLQTYQKREKYTNMTTNYTKRPEIIPNRRRIYKHFPFQSPPKYAQIGIFGHKIKLSGNTAADTISFSLWIPVIAERIIYL